MSATTPRRLRRCPMSETTRATIYNYSTNRRHLRCACCDGDAGHFKQHWNQDTGYGLCARCVDLCARGTTPEEFLSRYGVEGVNWSREKVEG